MFVIYFTTIDSANIQLLGLLPGELGASKVTVASSLPKYRLSKIKFPIKTTKESDYYIPYIYTYFHGVKISLYSQMNPRPRKLILAKFCPGTVSLPVSDRQPSPRPQKPSRTSSHSY